jgi:hypothetical protein
VTLSSTGLLTGGRKRNPSGGPVVEAASKLASGASKKNPGSSPGSYLMGLKSSRASGVNQDDGGSGSTEWKHTFSRSGENSDSQFF